MKPYGYVLLMLVGVLLVVSACQRIEKVTNNNNNDPLSQDWNNLKGKGTQVCGNGVLEGNELCDLGKANGACPSGCSTLCNYNRCTKNDSEIILGDRVVVSGNPACLGTYWESSDSSELIYCRPNGDLGTVTQGPVVSGTEKFWYVTYDIEPAGWSSEKGLVRTLDKTSIKGAKDFYIYSVNTTNITTNSAIVNAMTSNYTNSTIEYGTSVSYGNVQPSKYYLSTWQVYELKGLQPNTDYHFRIRAISRNSNTVISNDYTFRTSG